METLAIEKEVKKSRIPAKLDLMQSVSGAILGLFMWGHMLLVSSILLGEETMYYVAKTLEGGILTGYETSFPILVTFAAAGVFSLFILHAMLGMRKFPQNFRQWREIRKQVAMMDHQDTNQWYIQAVTGFIMFFLGSVHLYVIMTQPANIGPYASSDRMVTNWMWPLYLVLLFAVEMHGTIGLYRVACKWGWFVGPNPRAGRKRLKALKRFLTVFFLVLGLATLGAYIKIGVAHKDKAGEHYVPAQHQMK